MHSRSDNVKYLCFSGVVLRNSLIAFFLGAEVITHQIVYFSASVWCCVGLM
jgi:hypothetical protein